jgi:hypothetical protein
MRMHGGLSGLIAGSVTALLIGATAHAQNLDEGKSAAQLFANGCTACHRNSHGLAKGRFKLQLFMFLKQHYTTSSDEAWALAAYLGSVDGTPRGRPRTGPAKHAPRARNDGDPVVRPPAPVR